MSLPPAVYLRVKGEDGGNGWDEGGGEVEVRGEGKCTCRSW